MNHSPATIRPHKYWYAVSLVVLVVGIGLALWQMKGGASQVRKDAQGVRDRNSVRLDHTESYSVYVYRGASQRMDASANRAWNAAKSARVVVRNEQTGAELAVRRVFETTELQNNLVARLVDFDVPASGQYVVQIEPSLDVLNPVVRPSVSLGELRKGVMGFVVSLFLGLGIGVLSVVVAVAIFVVVLVRRNKCKKQLGYAAAIGAARQ